MDDKEIKDITARWEKAASEELWKGTANVPFYVILDKPRPSLSKHEGTKRGEGMWHYDDGVFIACAKRDMGQLLKYIKELEDANKIKEIRIDMLEKSFNQLCDET